MDQKGWKGSITVFLSITCILFLSLICAAVESARIQGARAQSANITGMGNFSLLSEYENALLEKYNLLALDGTYGSGSFKLQKAEERLKGYLSANANPGKNFLAGLCTDPWRLTLKKCNVKSYQLLTDRNGEAFYQQAVDFMKVNAGSLVISQLLDYAEDAEKIKKYQESYEEAQKKNEVQIAELEEQRKQKLEELQKAQEDSERENQGTDITGGNEATENKVIGNEVIVKEPEGSPLDEIKKLRKKSVLSIVTGDKAISDKKIKQGNLPSRSITQKGNYRIKEEHSGLSADVLFREYLLMHFPNYLSEKKSEGLDYQAEYLISGKSSDQANLKDVVNKLLLLREGMNYLYCLQDAGMNMEAGSVAAAFTGFLGIPAITTATQHALLLAWAYGESLVDVRILLDGGKVPVNKEAADWNLSMDNLGKITEILQQGKKENDRGVSYYGYLRILLNLGTIKKQKMRALDMIQTELRAKKETSGFKAENCITAVRTSTQWECAPMFSVLPAAIMGTGNKNRVFVQEGSISY